MSLPNHPATIVLLLTGAAVALALFLVASGDEKDAEAAFPPGQGGKIVFPRSQSGARDIWVMDSDGGNQVNVTADQAEDAYYPSWSPDGTKLPMKSMSTTTAPTTTSG